MCGAAGSSELTALLSLGLGTDLLGLFWRMHKVLLDLKVADLLDDLEITIIGAVAQEASGWLLRVMARRQGWWHGLLSATQLLGSCQPGTLGLGVDGTLSSGARSGRTLH